MCAIAEEHRLFWFRILPVSGARCQPACKPGFVWRAVSRTRWPFLWDGRCRPPRATNPGNDPETNIRIPQPRNASAEKRLASPLFGFAPGGAYHAAHVAMRAVRSYRTVSPLPRGGLFSVALSLGLLPPEVIRHRVSVEPGLSSTAKAAAIRPAGPSHIGALGHFVNYQISNSWVVQMPHDDKFPDPRTRFPA